MQNPRLNPALILVAATLIGYAFVLAEIALGAGRFDAPLATLLLANAAIAVIGGAVTRLRAAGMARVALAMIAVHVVAAVSLVVRGTGDLWPVVLVNGLFVTLLAGAVARFRRDGDAAEPSSARA
jgi:hypothetical protein